MKHMQFFAEYFMAIQFLSQCQTQQGKELERI